MASSTEPRAARPVWAVLEGSASVVTETPAPQRFLDPMNATCPTEYTMDFMDPLKNASARVAPRWAFGVAEGDVGGSPARWGLSS